MRIYIISILLLIFSLSSYTAQNEAIIKELTALRDSYERASSFSVTINYSLYIGNSTKSTESYSAQLTKKEKEHHLKSKEQVSIVNKNHSMTINHLEKMILLQNSIKESEVDPSSIDVATLLKMSYEYEAIKGDSKSKGVSFKFHNSQYKQIDVFYDPLTYFVKQLNLIVRVPKGEESQKLVIRYTNMNTKPSIPSNYFSLDRYVTIKDQKASLTPSYKDYKLIN